MANTPSEERLARAREALLRSRIKAAARFDLQTSEFDGTSVLEEWRFPVESRHAQSLRVRFNRNFPLSLPEIFAVDGSLFGRIPNVNRDGKVCYCDEETSVFDPSNAAEATLWAIDQSLKILDIDEATITQDSFTPEIHSYLGAPSEFISLLEDLDTPRVVNVIWLEHRNKGSFSFVACEDLEFAKRWVSQSRIDKPTITGKALFVPGGFPIRPPFPSVNKEVYKHMLGCDAKVRKAWEKHLREHPNQGLFITPIDSPRGKALMAWDQPRQSIRSNPYRRSGGGHVVPGFRAGKAPISLEMDGWGGNHSIRIFQGVRADLPRLINRTLGASADSTFKHVVIIGVGAIGSQLLLNLCESAQFERVSIIDPDGLSIENIPRHAANFSHVNRKKADVMAQIIGEKCPWLEIDAIPKNVLDSDAEIQSWLNSADTVILATGHEYLEKSVATRFLRDGKDGVAVHRLWLTAGAEQGHIVRYVKGTPGCPECSKSFDGHEDPTTLSYEPGCVAGYAQYGGSRLKRFISVAMDSLLQPVDTGWYRIWSSRPIDRPNTDDSIEIHTLTENPCALCRE